MSESFASRLAVGLVLAGVLGAVSARTTLVFASPTAIIAVSPSTIFAPGLDPGSVFRIDITVDDVNNLWGYQFVLGYNTAILTATDFGRYPPLESYVPGSSGVDDAAGTVSIVAYTFLGDHVGVNFSDPSPVAWIEFVVDGVGTSHLDLRDSIFADPEGSAISHSAYDGMFSNEHIMVPEFPLGFAVELFPLLGVAFVMLRKRHRNK